MTHFSLTDDFECTPQELWELFEDDEFSQRLGEETEQRRQTVERRTEDGVEYRRIRCVSLREIPTVMKKALGIERFEYEREHRLDREQGVMEWKVTTPFLAERVDAHGTTRLENTEEGTRRSVDGQVEVQLPLVGSKMETKLAEKLRDADEKAAAVAREMLQQR